VSYGLAPTSIKTRLALWYTTVLFLILVVISGLSYSLLARALVDDVDRSLLSVAKSIRDAAGHGPDAIRAVAASASLDSGYGKQFVQIVDAHGERTYASPRLESVPLKVSAAARRNAATGDRTFETTTLGQERVRLVTLPVIRNGKPGELIEAGVSLARTHQTLVRYAETLLVLVPLGLGLGVAGGTVMARAALKPMDALATTARRIGAEDLSGRLPLRGTDDELDRLAQTLNDMFARLEAAFVEMRRFSADAAHELRTPLTALKGGLEVALRAGRTTEEYRNVLVASLDEVNHLIRLAEDLLMVARSSDAVAPHAPIDLDQLALEVVDVGVRLGTARGVAVRIEVDEPVKVRGHAAALRRAALNLVENAVKYTPAGGLVTLNVGRDDDTGLLSVRDTGPGIPPADRTRVFEPFVRLDAARDRESGGSGLGLAITRSIVAAHGGTLTLDGAPGGGAHFVIRLPVAG